MIGKEVGDKERREVGKKKKIVEKRIRMDWRINDREEVL